MAINVDGGGNTSSSSSTGKFASSAISSLLSGVREMFGADSSSAVSPVGPSSSGGTTSGGGYSGGGLSYGYGSIGSGSSGPTDDQQKAFDNLGAIVGENADNLRDKFDNSMDMLDTADQMNQSLRDVLINQGKQQAGSDWFRQHLKLQRTASALNDRSGNAMRGSYLYDYRDLLAAADDNIDAETLDTMRENANSAFQSYFESLMQNINSRNETAVDTESALRELYADYLAQGNNIHPDLVADYLDTEGHSVKPMDWLSTDFYDEHKREAATPETQGLYRPDQANTQAREQGLTGGNYSTASAVAGSYWDRMNRGYDQRTRQA